ncbi:MAG: YlbF family regulator [Syntrophomonas sp.]|nr:YlbF family regulator [Syntrophomonas sp.]
MNENPYDKAHELVRALKANEAYQNLVEAQRKLDSDPEAKQRLNLFRNLQMEVNQAEMLGQPVADQQVQQVALEYAKLNRNKLIAAVFEAEAAFIQLFSDIQQIIQKGLESDFTL